MGRTKVKPLQKSAISLISSQPTFLYWKGTSIEEQAQRLPPKDEKDVAEVAKNDVTSSTVSPHPGTNASSSSSSSSSTEEDAGQIIQSSQVVLLVEDGTKEDTVSSTIIKCIICSDNKDDNSASDDAGTAPSSSSTLVTSNITTVEESLTLLSFELDSTKVYHTQEEKIILSIYCTDKNTIKFHLQDEDSLAVLLSLCTFLYNYINNNNNHSLEQLQRHNAKFSIHNNLMELRNISIQPLLLAISQELLSVVVTVVVPSSIIASSTTNNLQQQPQDCCYYSTASIHVEISLTKNALEWCHPNISEKSKKSKVTNIILKEALAILYPETLLSDMISSKTSVSGNTGITAKMFYNAVDNANHNNNYWTNTASTSIPGLLPTLRPYQEAAVRWMASREQANTLQYEDEYWKVSWVVLLGESLQPLYNFKLHNKHNNIPIFYNPFTGCICTSIEEVKTSTTTNGVRGGILAESMGLGKTVEVLACILSNPCPTSVPNCLEPKFDDITDIKSPFKNNEEDTYSSFKEEQVSLVPEPKLPPIAQGLHNSDHNEVESTTHNLQHNENTTTQAHFQHHNISNDEGNQGRVARKVNSPSLSPGDFLEDIVCFCGRTDLFPECFGWVRCESCEEYMHGSCADFLSKDQMLMKTTKRKGSTIPWCSATRCPCCVGETINHKYPIHSRATIIITPPAILDQWHREIRRHVSLDLKIIIYPGIREMCSKGKVPNVKYCHVKNLADADIILTTFPSLMGDLHHSAKYLYEKKKSVQRSFRKRKRYRVLPSPLPSILFWRCCLDEAQRVEAPTAASAKMALNLLAVNKWCVTGTPIARGKLEDLYGLFLFLGISPFNDKQFFKHCFQSSYPGAIERLQFTLRDIFWRSTKANTSVREQIGIPEQVEHKTILKFSSVEKHFYQKQLEETILAASQVTQDYEKGKGFKKLKGDEHVLSINLQRLRAACCHPQVGSGGIGRLGSSRGCGTSLASGVLTMDQILDRLIDDAKTKCEESQRIAVMHSNAIASLNRLKVEARHLGYVNDLETHRSDLELLKESAHVYTEALELTKTNAAPCEAVGESTVTGCIGFLTPGAVVRNGKATLQWQMKNPATDSLSPSDYDTTIRELWARFDFEGPAKKLTAIKMRQLPCDSHQGFAKVLIPKTCLLQVSNIAVGGEFVDVCEFTLPNKIGAPEAFEWITAAGFRTNKSRSWRVVIKDYYSHKLTDASENLRNDHYVVAVEVQLSEPEIGTDDLQRIHISHNTTLVLKTILELSKFSNFDNDVTAIEDFKVKLCQMQTETAKLEELYLGYAIVIHRESRRQLELAIQNKEQIERSMRNLINSTKLGDQDSIVEDVCLWWSDFLSWCRVNHEKYAMEFTLMVHQTKDYLAGFEDALMRDHKIRVPEFNDLNGLYAVLHSKMMDHASKKKSDYIIQNVASLSDNPSEDEIIENSRCGRCRTDFGQQGPICRHCRLEDELKALDGQVNDYLCFLLLRCVGRGIREGSWLNKTDEQFISSLRDRAKVYYKWQDARKQEIVSAKLYWKVHFNLLSAIDELNQCKRTMRLLHPGETFRVGHSEASDIVPPNEIQALIWDHQVKQAMALSQLRRDKNTLRYLRNQTKESACSRNSDKDDAPTCVVCLCKFGEERAVLSCGHCFHYSPCLEQLIARSGGGSTISCPMRCNTRTSKDQIMIASVKSKKDGSHSRRKVNGSWGTKVERLVGDLLDVIDIGDKSIVFSQWEDLLTIVEQALIANQIEYVRPKGQSNIGACAKRFRGSDIPVLILNVKCGAEGLSLIEATHVFMVEPLLHCGLDAQAINRVHRIGQTSMTHVHRYIMEDTIEVKIDALRMEMQETHEEDELGLVTKDSAKISAGGIDGGFSASQLKEILK